MRKGGLHSPSARSPGVKQVRCSSRGFLVVMKRLGFKPCPVPSLYSGASCPVPSLRPRLARPLRPAGAGGITGAGGVTDEAAIEASTSAKIHSGGSVLCSPPAVVALLGSSSSSLTRVIMCLRMPPAALT